MTQGRYAEAERYLEQKIPDPANAKSSDLIWFCQSQFKLKKYRRLFGCLDHLETNIIRGDRYLTGDILLTAGPRTLPYDLTLMPHLMRAEAYIETGNYAKAVTEAEKAYHLAVTISWPMWDVQINWERIGRIRALGLLAMAYAFAGEKEKAQITIKKLEDEGLGISARYFVEKEKTVALGRAYMAARMYDKILERQGDFLLAFAHVFSLGVMKAVEAGNTFAYLELPKKFVVNKALFETGQIAAAKEGYDKLLAYPGTKDNGELYWPILFDRGQIYEREGDNKRAIELYSRAIDVIEAQRSTINTEASKIGFLGNKQHIYHRTISALLSSGDQNSAFEYVERAKARALVDMLAANKTLAARNRPAEMAALLNQLEDVEAGEAAKNIPTDNTVRTMRSINIKETIKRADPELASLVSVIPPNLDEIRLSLNSDETLIEYYYEGEHLYAFVLAASDLTSVRLNGMGLAEEVQNYRKALQNPASSDHLEISRRLYDRLLAPVDHLLKSNNLVIIPHGILHYLPFGTLASGSGFLLERHGISYLPSASVLKFLKEKPANRIGNALIVGNPSLREERYSLKYAEQEARIIAEKFPSSRVLVRKEATETGFKYLAGNFRYIHVASHGFFASDSPLDSGLLLAGDEKNDGVLSVLDIYSLRLSADLVTLSACETALGKVNPGDDVVGLIRGFLYAGASSIVASLWQVDDAATSELMDRFYTALTKTDKREALRKAQIDMMKKYEHPFYWAAFQLTGVI